MPTPAEIAQQARTLAASGRGPESEALLRRAVAQAPGSVELLAALGFALAQSGRDPEAIGHLQRASQLAPQRPDIWYYLGVALARQDRLPEAVTALQRSVQLAPNPHATELLGVVLIQSGDPAQAEQVLVRARQLDPVSVSIAGLYGSTLQMLARISESAQVMEASARAHPDDADARLAAAILHSYWEQGDPARIREHLEHRGRLLTARAGPPLPPSTADPSPDRRLRVGFLCQDIRKDSAIARFIAAPALHLDRAQFELLGYCTQPTMDRMTSRLRGALPWSDVTRLDDNALLARLRADRLDLIVETAGNTPGNRLGALARRAAPVQVTCIGDPRTTGIPAMDYRIVDEVTDPSAPDDPGRPPSDAYCTEKLVRLPGCFLCYEPHDDAPADRASAGAPAPGAITFASFNVPDKTGPGVIETWSSILKAVPGSRMVLRAWGYRPEPVRRLYLDRFRAHGIDASRVEFGAHHGSMGEHLAQYQRVDIALDPFPYNGTTTSCDCLWMGVPFVALRGRWHAARVGASLLTAVGLPELIAGTREEYIRLAAALASDPARLAEIHRTLRARMASSPLGDSPAYARKLGAAYRAMWQDRLSTRL